MSEIPRDPALDSTLSVLTDGYEFIWKRCQRMNTDIFQARVMGKKAVCIHGREAAKIFYDGERFQRQLALPRRVVTSLFGKGAVHTLDDAAHHHRKAAFLSLMSPQSLEQLMQLTAAHWRMAVRRWERQERVVLFDEVGLVLAGGVCQWAGVPLSASELPKRARDLARWSIHSAALAPDFGRASWRARAQSVGSRVSCSECAVDGCKSRRALRFPLWQTTVSSRAR